MVTSQGLKLYDYQAKALSDVRLAWDEGLNKVILQLPTGAGKTEVACKLVMDWLQDNPRQDIIFLVHRKDLVEQTYNRFLRYGIPVIKGSGSGGRWNGGPRPKGVIVMGVLTFKNRLQANKDAGKGAKVIIDECHWYPDDGSSVPIREGEKRKGSKSSWGNVINQLEGDVLGLSATPWRMGVEECFSPTWNAMVMGPQTNTLIEEGYLADYRLQDVGAIIRKIQLVGKQGAMRAKSSQDTVDTAETFRYYNSNDLLRGTITTEAVGAWYAVAKDEQTIVFALTVEHAYMLKQTFNGMGKVLPGLDDCEQVAEVIEGNTPDGERAKILKGFEEKRIRCLIGVDVMREGFDAPEASCLVVLRPTDSLALWRQMCGRVLRVKKDGKKARILDFVGNYKTQGFPDDPYTWSLEARDTLEPGTGSPYKVCRNVNNGGGLGKNCYAVNPLARHYCNDPDCNAVFGQICPTERDGCGEFRFWSSWTGGFQSYKAGTCDQCGEKAEEFQGDMRRANAAPGAPKAG